MVAKARNEHEAQLNSPFRVAAYPFSLVGRPDSHTGLTPRYTSR